MSSVSTLIDTSEPPVLGVLLFTLLAGILSLSYLYQLIAAPKKTLPTDDFKPFPLIRKDVLSHDTRRFTFALPSKNHILGLPIGQHVSLKFTNKEGKDVTRSYTPVESNLGEVSLVIKVYRPAPPRFPNGGAMSQHLDDLNIGDTILLKGPKGHMEFFQTGKPGSFKVKPLGKPLEQRYCEQIGMMAGGTGITPMLQILHQIFRNPTRYPHMMVSLIYANQTEQDILVREELEELQKLFPGRFRLWYTIDRIENKDKKKWKYSTGFISADMVQEHLLFTDKSKPTQFFMVRVLGIVLCSLYVALYMVRGQIH